MQNNTKIVIVILLVILIAINIANSCKREPDIEIIKEQYKENQKQIELINKDIIDIKVKVMKSLSHIDSLNQSNKRIIQNYSNEISKLDKLFKNSNDTMLVNAVLRYWTDRLYKIPEFFQSTAPDL